MASEKVLQAKQEKVDALTEQLKNASACVLVDYKGINVADDTKLRRELREAGYDGAKLAAAMPKAILGETVHPMRHRKRYYWGRTQEEKERYRNLPATEGYYREALKGAFPHVTCRDEFMEYEYWIDDQMQAVTAAGICPGVIRLEIDGESLSVGKHTLYFRAKTWAEIYGETYSYEFEIVDDWDAITEVHGDDEPSDVFTVDGKIVRHQAMSLEGLPKGIYIFKGQKVLR